MTHLYPSEQTLDLVLQSLIIAPNTSTLHLNDFCGLLPYRCGRARLPKWQ